MISHAEIDKNELRRLIKLGVIVFGGNKKLKIYGTLNCISGKKMKRENRIFFNSEAEALQHRFRPCGKCLKEKYLYWKNCARNGLI